jgi:NAD+ synthase (glutamine-hydrolysing)
LKIALAQLNYHIGNFPSNVSKIIAQIKRAEAEGADLVVFSELAISGYPPRDFLEFREFIDLCENYLSEIAGHCHSIAAIIGSPVRNDSGKGKKLFNAACFLHRGKIEFIQRKTLLPTYDVFDEYRYFEPNNQFNLVEYKGKKLALTICEDIWDVGESKLYDKSPGDELAKLNPDYYINISASPYSKGHYQQRCKMLMENAKKYKSTFIYVNHVGAQTELIFDGRSMACNADGRIVKTMKAFEEDFWIYDTEQVYEDDVLTIDDRQDVLNALVTGISDYFRKSNFTKAVIGLSGGIDSALTVVIASQALGPENVTAVMMPSPYSSDHSVDDSVELCRRVGCKSRLIKIHDLIEGFDKALEDEFAGLSRDITEENIQARVRSILLMAISNKFGNILLNTSNKSEKAVGYGTLYGDLSGGLSVLGDVYKTEVYKLAGFVNKDKEVIPKNIITKEPSAELRHDQKDSDSLPDYDELDPVLFQYIEENKSAPEIIDMGFDESLVRNILTLVNRNEYKRFQTAPILRVSKKAFGMGRRMPIVGKYLS